MAEIAVDETSPLLVHVESRQNQERSVEAGIRQPEDKPARSVLAILSVLLIGMLN